MSRLFLILVIVASIFASENFKQIKIFPSKEEFKEVVELGISMEHAMKSKDGGIVIFVSDSEFKELSQLNIRTKIMIDDWLEHYLSRDKMSEEEKALQLAESSMKFGVDNFEFGSLDGFYTYNEVIGKVDELIKNYPNLVGGLELVGQTHEGRNLIAFKVSDNPDVDEDEPEVLYTALHHAREPEGMMQLFYFIQYLVDNYNSNDEVKYLVDNRELYFIPVVNPDGYVFNEDAEESGGRMWRKNRRDNNDGSYGVDLNRNYGPMEYWDAPNGGSDTETYSYTYRGPEPFSEPEVTAIKDFLNNREITACLNYHTYSNLLIFPYGALETETADSNTFREFAEDMTTENNYLAGTDMQTVNYSTRGNSDDYMYDGEPGRDKIFAMTPEVGGLNDGGFWANEDRIIPLAEENLMPNLYYANVAGSYPAVIDLNYDTDFVLPGDAFTLKPVVKNKGLVDSGEFEVTITPLNEAATVVTDNAVIINNLEARSEITPEAGFGIQVSQNVKNNSDLVFEFGILQEGLVRRLDTLSIKIGKPVVLFEDNADSLEAYWSSVGSIDKWERTSKYSYSGDYSYTDSKGGNYRRNANTKLTLNDEIDLSGLSNAYLTFRTKFHIEAEFDAGFVEISSDGGSSWKILGSESSKSAGDLMDYPDVSSSDKVYYGAAFNWKLEEVNLSEFLDQNILIRFSFRSDYGVEIDGWYIDDIKVVSYDFSTGVPEDEVVYQFRLEQNYPNPFNPATKINYQIPGTGFVSIKIYDILGREVANLVNEVQNAGEHSVEFSSNSHFSSGIYLYKLESGSFSQTRKMLLLK